MSISILNTIPAIDDIVPPTPAMPPETLEALRLSIKHWEENVAAVYPAAASIGSDGCALCQKFRDNDCVGCPVAEHTNKEACKGTPYYPAISALHLWLGEPKDASHREQWRIAAQAELDFLRSLLPTGAAP